MFSGITDLIDMNLSKLWETVEDRGACHAIGHEMAKNWTGLSNRTTTNLLKQALEHAFETQK